MAGFSVPAFAGGLMPGNGGILLPPLSHPPSASTVSLTDGYVSLDAFEKTFGVQNGRMDFFALRPKEDGGFKPMLRGGVGDGGLQLQLKW